MPGLSEKVFLKYKCGLRKDRDSCSYLIKLIEKWKAANYKNELFVVSVLTKVYRTLLSAFDRNSSL